MQLPFRITICGIDELAGHCDVQVTHVLSILDPDRDVPDAFASFGAHEKVELRFDDVCDEQPAKQAPQRRDVEALLDFGKRLDGAAGRGAHLLVHCHAGISRSSAALALLLAQAMPHCPSETIFGEILKIRPQIWPNLRIVELGDALLQRGGETVAAAQALYARQLKAHPDWEALFRDLGRGREIDTASAPAV